MAAGENMTLTVADIDRWRAEAVREVFHAAGARGIFLIEEELQGLLAADEIGGAQLGGSLEADVIPVDLDAAGEARPKTSQDLARDMLKRMGVRQYWNITDKQLAELVALIERSKP